MEGLGGGEVGVLRVQGQGAAAQAQGRQDRQEQREQFFHGSHSFLWGGAPFLETAGTMIPPPFPAVKRRSGKESAGALSFRFSHWMMKFTDSSPWGFWPKT